MEALSDSLGDVRRGSVLSDAGGVRGYAERSVARCGVVRAGREDEDDGVGCVRRERGEMSCLGGRSRERDGVRGKAQGIVEMVVGVLLRREDG